MKKKKILFSGYYGFDNLGDDMFGLVSVWGAKKYWSNNNTALLSGKGAKSENIDISFVLPSEQKYKINRILKSYLEVLKTNFLILSGGSILSARLNPFSPRGFMYLLSKVKLLKVGAIGVSVGPFKSEDDYEYIKSVLKNFKFLVLRDKMSYNISCGMDLPYTPILAADLAFMLPRIKGISLSKNKNNIKKIIGISLCHYERYVGRNIDNEKRREDTIYTVLNELKKDKNIMFRFFVINGNRLTGDLELTQSMIKQLSLETKQYELISYSSHTLEVFDLIDACDLMYSTRLHGAIFAAAANVPSLLVEYHQKCTDYLDDIGIDQEWRIGDMQVSPTEVAIKIKKLLKGSQNSFYPNRQEMINLSQKNFIDKVIVKEIV